MSETVGRVDADPRGDPRAHGVAARPHDGDQLGAESAQVTLSPSQTDHLMAAADAIGRGETVEEVASVLVDMGLSAVHGTRGTVALLDDEGTHLELVASSGYDASYLSGWQRFPLAAELPLTEAVRTGRHVVVASVEEFERRYPGITLPDRRPHALVAVPLHADGRIVGGWGIRLETSPDPCDDRVAEATAGSQYLATVASAGIARVAAVQALKERVGQLQHALTSRVAIEQAKGVLSERHGITPQEAFEAFRRYARNKGQRVHEVAAAVVAGDLDPVCPDGHAGS